MTKPSEAQYQRVASTGPEVEDLAASIADQDDESPSSIDGASPSTRREMNRPPPATWKRAAVLIAMVALFWLSIKIGAWQGFGGGGNKKPEIIYATRYSDEFKYRPAASPVITETLKDGRIRIRGANPAGVGVAATSLPTQKSSQQRAAERSRAEEEALEAAKRALGIKSKPKAERIQKRTMAEMIKERQKSQGFKNAADMYGPQGGSNKVARRPPGPGQQQQPQRHPASDEI